eukprot:COSAG01_NODE_10484_length_2155_cov_1.139105_1_plen_127_part_00
MAVDPGGGTALAALPARFQLSTTLGSSMDAGQLRRLFDDIDQDRSGFLDEMEVSNLAERLGRRLNPAQLQRAMAEMDACVCHCLGLWLWSPRQPQLSYSRAVLSGPSAGVGLAWFGVTTAGTVTGR